MWTIGIAAALLSAAGAALPASAPLELESKIPLGSVRGRIDHLAADLHRHRLFVSEFGNDSVGVIDLGHARIVRTLEGLPQPQGIGYVASTDTLYVANAGDGSVRLFRGANLAPAGQIALGQDADDVRVDEAAHRLFVGYGDGALAIIDTMRAAKIADIPLKAHPEGFQFERSGARIFVNVPGAREIALIDRANRRQVSSWPTDALRENFPLALDEQRGRILAVFRDPAKLGVFRVRGGHLLASLDTCRDADDVFIDPKRNRLYVICGEGRIDVIAEQRGRYADLGRIATVAGARTGLFVAQWDRLFVAVRATSGTPAALWVFRPMG
ncbi:MAG: YncE family protein [Steroidobacteraceae bacterium]